MSLANKIILGVVLAASLALMVGASIQEAAITDEKAHIPAGYGYVKHFDYRLNPEHPPIVKIAAGIPLLFIDVNFPTDHSAWQDGVNAQWTMGDAFLYQSGNDADQIIQWARMGPIIITLLLVIFIYMWSKELLGAWWALLPASATALSPHFLSHGHFVTTDIGAALGILVSLYYFNRYLITPKKKSIILAGAAFGFAQLMKYSAAILVGHFILMILIYALVRGTKDKEKIKKTMRLGFRYLGQLFLIFAVGGLIIYPVYLLTTVGYPVDKQLSDTVAIIGDDFQTGPLSYLADLVTWAADKPIVRPIGQYLLGLLMVFKRSSEGNTLYFLGNVDISGGAKYFPIVYVMKETLPMLILLLLGAITALQRVAKSLIKKTTKIREYITTNIHEFSALLFIGIYLAYSMSSPLNIGFRHLMPIIPLMYILATVALKKTVHADPHGKNFKAAVVISFIIWQGGVALTSFPHYLPYFNEFIGTDNGWQYVTDSNYDWGQDLKRLDSLVEEQGIDRLAIHYFGAGSPEYYMPGISTPWNSRMGNPMESGIQYLAVSVNELQNSVPPAASRYNRDIEAEYRWLEDPYRPDFIAGKSIFVYDLQNR